MSEKKRDYESTVMRMAGNIAAGLASCRISADQTYSDRFDVITRDAVELARQIVAEVERTRLPAEGAASGDKGDVDG